MSAVIKKIQLDQAKRQVFVDWHRDHEAIAILKAAADANHKADRVKPIGR
jgi:hypothetical protein